MLCKWFAAELRADLLPRPQPFGLHNAGREHPVGTRELRQCGMQQLVIRGPADRSEHSGGTAHAPVSTANNSPTKFTNYYHTHTHTHAHTHTHTPTYAQL